MRFIQRQLAAELRYAAKATRTPVPRAAEPLLRLDKAMRGYDVHRFVVHRPARSQRGLSTLSPGVKPLPVDRLKDLWPA